jgi:hypothetical protein
MLGHVGWGLCDYVQRVLLSQPDDDKWGEKAPSKAATRARRARAGAFGNHRRPGPAPPSKKFDTNRYW